MPEAGHLGLGLHLPEGEGEGGEEPQTGDHHSHQVICQPGGVKVTQISPETLSYFILTFLVIFCIFSVKG